MQELEKVGRQRKEMAEGVELERPRHKLDCSDIRRRRRRRRRRRKEEGEEEDEEG